MTNILHPKSYSSDLDIYEDFKKNHFVSIKDLIDINKLDILKNDLERFLQNVSNNSLSFHHNVLNLTHNNPRLLYEFQNKSEALLTLFNIGSDIFHVINVLNDHQPAKVHQHSYLLGIPKDNRLTYDFHQEASFMNIEDDIYNVHFPIFSKSSLENGTMSFLKGSHVEGQLEYKRTKRSRISYTDLVPNDIALLQDKFDEYYCELDVGDCFIFGKHLVHKSNYNNTEQCRTVGIWRIIGNIDSNIEWESFDRP